MLIDGRCRDITKSCHHLLRQPDIFVLVAHLHAFRAIAGGGGKGQVFRRVGADRMLWYMWSGTVTPSFFQSDSILLQQPLRLSLTRGGDLSGPGASAVTNQPVLCQFIQDLEIASFPAPADKGYCPSSFFYTAPSPGVSCSSQEVRYISISVSSLIRFACPSAIQSRLHFLPLMSPYHMEGIQSIPCPRDFLTKHSGQLSPIALQTICAKVFR